MDLKIKDVAELLSVSETTVRRWLVSGQIPAYKLNHQYRFNRLEIENWMMSCRLKPVGAKEETEIPIAKSGLQQFSLFRALHKGDVITHVSHTSKQDVIRLGAKAAAEKLGLDEDLVAELLLDREELMSTAVGHGVAVPHPRDLIVKGGDDLIVVAFLEKPIPFGGLDNIPVHTVFFLFSSQDKKHLHLLAKISHLSSQKNALDWMRTHPEKEEMLAFVRSWEGSISS